MGKVPVQKGPISPAMKTMKSMTHPEKVAQRHQEVKDFKSSQTLTLHTPKQK